MLAHPALYAHPAPARADHRRRRLRHAARGAEAPGIERVVQCDIDEAVTRAAVRQFFPRLTEANDDPRANWCSRTA